MVLVLVVLVLLVVVKRSGQGSREVYWPVCVMAPLGSERVDDGGNCGVGVGGVGVVVGGEEVRPGVKGGELASLNDGSLGIRKD